MRRNQSKLYASALATMALSALAATAPAQVMLRNDQMEELQSMNGEFGQGFGTWIEAGSTAGAAFAELANHRGVMRYLLEAEVTAYGDGTGEVFPHGTLTGDLYAYKLFIVPTEQESLGSVVGEWLMVGNNQGLMQAVVYGRDPMTGLPISLGALEGTFQFEPFLYDPDLQPPAATSAAGSSAGAQGAGIGQQADGHDIPYLGPFAADDTTAQRAGGGQEAQYENAPAQRDGLFYPVPGSSDPGRVLNGNLPYLGPTPAGRLGAQNAGSGSLAGMQELGGASAKNGPGSGPAAPSFGLGGSGYAASDAGTGTQASGEQIQDRGEPQSENEGEGSGDENRRFGSLSLNWVIYD